MGGNKQAESSSSIFGMSTPPELLFYGKVQDGMPLFGVNFAYRKQDRTDIFLGNQLR